MSTIQDLFQQTLLAEAAYANFWNSSTNSTITDPALVKAALISEGMSEVQASDFVTQWQVVAQQPDMLSGFSATVFKNITTGEYTVSVRGTNSLSDWDYANVGGIALNGMAMGQAADMYNWMLRMTATQGQSIPQYQYIPESGIPGTPGYQAEELSQVGNITVTTNGPLAGSHIGVRKPHWGQVLHCSNLTPSFSFTR